MQRNHPAWKALVARHFDAIVRIVEGGRSLRDAVKVIDGGPNMNQVQHWLRTVRPDLRPVMTAALAKIGNDQHRFSEEDYDRALALLPDVPAGSIRAWKVEGLPNADTMVARSRRDAGFAVRLKAARDLRAQKVRPHTFSADQYSRAIDLIERHPAASQREMQGVLASAILPSIDAIKKRATINEDFRTRWRRVLATRPGRWFTEGEYQQALKIIACQPENFAGRVLQKHLNLPSLMTLRSRVARDPAFAATYREMMGTRDRQRQQVRAKPVYGQHMLYKALRQDDLYREADKLFHRGLPDRDDMIAEVVLAVLDGRLPRHELQERGAAIGWKSLNAMQGRWHVTTSLDVQDFGDGDPIVETITADNWSFEDAA